MSGLLLDASVVLAAFDTGNPQSEAAQAILDTEETTTLATVDLARYEVADVAIRSWRAPASVPPLLAALDRISEDGGLVLSGNTLLRDAAELAEREGISVYDASYVVAAALRGRRLVSCDVRDLVSKGLAVLPEDAG